MIILYLTQIFSSTSGGGPLIFFDLAKAMSERGHKVYVICSLATEKVDNTNVKVFTVKPLLDKSYELPPSPLQNLKYIANSIYSGIRIGREQKIDLIHTNSFTPVVGGSILSKLIRVPMVASIYDIFTDSDGSNWKNWVRHNDLPSYYSTIGRIYENISLKMPFNTIHTISNTTKNDILNHIDNKRIEVVYPAINDKVYGNTDSVYDNYILYIGRLVFYKNVDVLIKAFQEVIRQLPSAGLVIVGDGPMKEKWEDLSESLGVSNNVQFTGHISHEQKVNLLSRCTALALPSIFEGFGLVILEAFAKEKPVLVSNIPPLNEIVDDDIDGFILPYDNSHSWAGKIVDLLTNKQFCKNLGIEASKKVRTKFDFTEYVTKMECLYNQVAASYENRA